MRKEDDKGRALSSTEKTAQIQLVLSGLEARFTLINAA